MPDTTNMYRGIGKMFFKEPAPKVIEHLGVKAKEQADMVEALKVQLQISNNFEK